MEIIIFLTVSPESHRTAEENLGIEYLASNQKNFKIWNKNNKWMDRKIK